MATKTVSIDLEAYARLRKAKSSDKESFSQVIKRAVWPPCAGTAASLLALSRSLDDTKRLTDEVLERLDQNVEQDAPAPNRWDESA